MKTTSLILAAIFAVSISSLGKELTPKEARQYVRQPYGTKIVKDWKYDGWIIQGDIFFYNRIVRHLKIIEKDAPEMYAVGQKNVDLIVVPAQPNSCAWPEEKKIGISPRDLNYTHQSLVTYMIMHEFQHCDPRDGSEGAACWTVVQYGKQTGVHPWVIKCHTAYAIKHGYSQAKWDAHLRK